MDNLHLFELINASPGVSPLRLTLASALAQGAICLAPLGVGVAWVRGDRAARAELLQMLLAAVATLLLCEVVLRAWPQPRPFSSQLGTLWLNPGHDSGLPSEQVAACWSLALAALTTRRFGLWTFPLLILGLLVGWSRVYLGVHFPLDILAALPAAAAGAAMALALRWPRAGIVERTTSLYHRAVRRVRVSRR